MRCLVREIQQMQYNTMQMKPTLPIRGTSVDSKPWEYRLPHGNAASTDLASTFCHLKARTVVMYTDRCLPFNTPYAQDMIGTS